MIRKKRYSKERWNEITEKKTTADKNENASRRNKSKDIGERKEIKKIPGQNQEIQVKHELQNNEEILPANRWRNYKDK